MARAVVVGAGIAGAATAYHLVRAGHEVVVVDPGLAGAATDAGAGIVSAVSARQRPADEVAFTCAAVGHYPDLVAELEHAVGAGAGGPGYGAVGQLIVALDGEDGLLPELARRATATVAAHGGRGTGTPELVDGATARRLCPILGPVAGALWLPEVARVDGRSMRDRLLLAVRRGGGELVPAPAALGVRGGRTVTVRTPGRELGADVVVLAAGAWSADLAAQAGVPLPVRPQRGQIAHVSLPRFADLPVVTGFHTHYILSFPGGRIVFGATREDGTGFDPALTVGGIAETVAEATRVAPVLAEATWIEARVGLRPVTPDGAPVLGRSPQLDNLVVGTGFGPQGLTLGPYAGAVLARIAVGEQVAVPPAFAVARFAGPTAG